MPYNIPIKASNICDAAGQKIAAGFLKVVATNQYNALIPYQPSGIGQATTAEAVFTVTNGVLQAGVTLPDPAHTNPVGILYRFTVSDGTWDVAKYALVVVAVNDPDVVSFNLDLWNPALSTPTIPYTLIQGPQGPPGPADTVTFTATSTISAMTAVAVVGGALVQADKSLTQQCGLVAGLATNSATAGNPVVVQFSGEVTNSGWNWSPSLPCFVGSLGMLTQTPPTSGYSQIIGIPVSPTSLLIKLQQPVLL